MDDATPGPQRMRYAFESRCRAVAAIMAGLSPGVAAQAVGASRATGYRWRRCYVTVGWASWCKRLLRITGLPMARTRGGGAVPRAICGKAERFIQILLHRWAYAFAYPSSAHRARAHRLAAVV